MHELNQNGVHLSILCLNHMRTIRNYTATSIICTPLKNHIIPVQKYFHSKIKTMHYIAEGLSSN